ncbi:MAG: hypothetical protein WCC04_21780 [Terriglobales bacterium]
MNSKAPRMQRFAVRVCGIEVSNLTVRLVIRSGGRAPCHEIVFEDPIFGVLPLDDTLPIELWRFKGPVGRQKWQATNVRGLYAELILSGAIDVVGAGEGEKRMC